MSDEEKAVAPPKNDDTDRPANNLVESPPESKPRSSQAPNGGFDAWLQVAGAFVLYLNTW